MLKLNINQSSSCMSQCNLNTSHVKVKQKVTSILFLLDGNLNTSHVKVKPSAT